MAAKTSYTVARTAANNTANVVIAGVTLARKVRTAVCNKRERIEQTVVVDFAGANLESVLAYAASQMIIQYQADHRVDKDAPEREHQAEETWLRARPQHTVSAVAILTKSGSEITEDGLEALAARYGFKLVRTESVESAA